MCIYRLALLLLHPTLDNARLATERDGVAAVRARAAAGAAMVEVAREGLVVARADSEIAERTYMHQVKVGDCFDALAVCMLEKGGGVGHLSWDLFR